MNQFQFCLYDPLTSRWPSVDPYRQYYSPYVGMGNNPVSGLDKDGGWVFKGRAQRMWQRAFDQGLDPGDLYKVNNQWGFNTSANSGAGATFNFRNFGATGYTLWFDASIEANGRGVSGALKWLINYSDDGYEVAESWQARSGSSYVYGIESGLFAANFLRYRDGRNNTNGPDSWNTLNNGFTRDGVGFSLNILNSSDSLHRIHPDGNTNGNWQLNDGTLGCIGLQCSSSDLKMFEATMRTHLNNHQNIRLIITGSH